jgi:hypothetical protein
MGVWGHRPPLLIKNTGSDQSPKKYQALLCSQFFLKTLKQFIPDHSQLSLSTMIPNKNSNISGDQTPDTYQGNVMDGCSEQPYEKSCHEKEKNNIIFYGKKIIVVILIGATILITLLILYFLLFVIYFFIMMILFGDS